MSISIDTSVSVAALLGGIAGAGITAYLSYRVQISVRKWEDRRRRTRVLYVHYLSTTETVATDLVLSRVAKAIVQLFITAGEGFDVHHSAAAWCAAAIKDASPKAISKAAARMKSNMPVIEDVLTKIELRPTDLADFSPGGIIAYNRMWSQSFGLRVQLLQFTNLLNTEPAEIDVNVLHNVFASFRRYADSAALLRGSMIMALGISDAQSFADLQAADGRAGEDIKGMVGDNKSLAKAVEATQAADFKPTPEKSK